MRRCARLHCRRLVRLVNLRRRKVAREEDSRCARRNRLTKQPARLQVLAASSKPRSTAGSHQHRGTNGEEEEVHQRRYSHPQGSGRDRKGSKGPPAAPQEAPCCDGPHPWTESDERAPPLRGAQGQGSSAHGSL